jgi:Tfp pilus assembly protein PilO
MVMSKLTPQNRVILIILIAVILNAAIWFMGVDPSLQAVDKAKQDLAQLEQQETRLKQRLESLLAIDTVALEAELSELLIRVPEVGFLRELITELEASAKDMTVDFIEISFGTPGKEDDYLFMVINLFLGGSYSNLVRYISYLESNPRLIAVDSFLIEGENAPLGSRVIFRVFSSDFSPYTPHEAPGRGDPFRP